MAADDARAAVPLAVWLYLVCAHGGFWRPPRGVPAAPTPARWPSLGVVVPARNEAALLPRTLAALLAQRYPGELRLVLVDDESTDGTGEVGRGLAAGRQGGQERLLVVAGGPPARGWAGKPWALHQGVAALDAGGGGSAGDCEWLLFTDADILHPPGSLTALVAAAEDRRLDVLSLMARLPADRPWERVLIPAFVYFFALLYPFRWVSRRPAAAGGCVLVRRAALVRAGGIGAIADAVIDDIALARALHRAGARLELRLAEDVRGIRAYPGLEELWRMVTRSAYVQLRCSPALLALSLAGLALVFGGPPAALFAGLAGRRPRTAAAGALAWALMAGSYVPLLRHHRSPVALAPALPLVALLYMAMTVDSARRYYGARRGQWRGRALPGRRRGRRAG
jgi:hopene-associated glycosyltransferase HpnB